MSAAFKLWQNLTCGFELQDIVLLEEVSVPVITMAIIHLNDYLTTASTCNAYWIIEDISYSPAPSSSPYSVNFQYSIEGVSNNSLINPSSGT